MPSLQIGAIIKRVNFRNIPRKKDFLLREHVEFKFEEIEWQVYDIAQEKIVFSDTTTGFARKRGKNIEGAKLDAFKDSVQRLLNKEFFSRTR